MKTGWISVYMHMCTLCGVWCVVCGVWCEWKAGMTVHDPGETSEEILKAIL